VCNVRSAGNIAVRLFLPSLVWPVMLMHGFSSAVFRWWQVLRDGRLWYHMQAVVSSQATAQGGWLCLQHLYTLYRWLIAFSVTVWPSVRLGRVLVLVMPMHATRVVVCDVKVIPACWVVRGLFVPLSCRGLTQTPFVHSVQKCWSGYVGPMIGVATSE
jgi:hypothetical protein